MPWWGGVLLVLAGLPVLAYVVFLGLFWAASRSTPTRSFLVGFGQGALHFERRVYLHEHHWLARMLPGWGQSNHPHIYLDGELWPKGKPWNKWIDPPTTMAWQVGHELWHNWQKIVRDDLGWGISALWNILTRHWRNRPEEQEANAHQRGITLGTDPYVSAPWLADFVNAGGPS